MTPAAGLAPPIGSDYGPVYKNHKDHIVDEARKPLCSSSEVVPPEAFVFFVPFVVPETFVLFALCG